MSDSTTQKRSQDKKSIQCFFRISIGGEILSEDIVIELDIQNRPKTCESFLSLCADSGSIRSDVKDNARHANANNNNNVSTDSDSPIRTNRRSPQPTYRGCEFHRVVPGLCVQAGDWERFDGTGGFSPLYGRNWKDEKGTPGGGNNNKNQTTNKNNKHDREGIVSMANAGKPNTNGSQFFVTLKPTPHLDGKHTVFGRVVSGMESVRKMADVEREEKDRPVSLQRIVIEDCGRFSLRRKQQNSSSGNNNNEEDGDGDGDDDRCQSRSEKKHKRKKGSKKSERKKHDKKRHR
jgi:cyclophilin family peptidyl-prolyl cis-trans isomerase